ncbi:MAG: AMP-binding protein [Gaiellaceae bacterium]
MYETKPWLQFYGDIPQSLEYPRIRLDEVVARSAARLPEERAFDFLGSTTTYAELNAAIERCAAGLAALGVKPDDRITISMPTSPQGVIAFYAASRLGAVSSIIHPLSTPDEIAHYLTLSDSRFALTLDAFYGRFAEILDRTPLETLILARIPDELSGLKRLGFWATRGRKIPSVPADADVTWWTELMGGSHAPIPEPVGDPDELATILYSGGTTGAPKGIMLSHANVTSEALQVVTWVSVSERDIVLAALPIFHGFGLSALIHAGLLAGAQLVMVPQFSPAIVAKLMRSKRLTVMAGVPTLYEALARHPSLRRADISSLRAAFSGGDALQASVRERFEHMVAERGGSVRLLEGYGLTEAVTAVVCNPLHAPRAGTLGIPFPDVLAKICEPGTDRECPPGEDGEICVSGPPVMLGYLDNPEATGETLQRHTDGRTWLHTGDIGHMDEDGFLTFTCRLKRMIKSSGFNVYPNQVEAVLEAHSGVAQSCVIGQPDETQGARVKAIVVVADDASAGDALADALIEHCRERLIKWSCPREIEFRDELPLTRLGKVDYRALEAEHAA